MNELTITPGFYKHWKGQIYYVSEVHIRRDTLPFVVYSACYGDNFLCTRPASEWFDVMGQKENGEPLYRFEKIKYEVAEVRHGVWIETNYFDAHKIPIYKCSVCFQEVADHYIKCHKYCLHCGAKMDGGSKDA